MPFFRSATHRPRSYDREYPDQETSPDTRSPTRRLPRQGLRLPRGRRATERIPFHRPHRTPRPERTQAQAQCSTQSSPVGSRTNAQLDEPFSADSRALGKARRHVCRFAASCFRADHLASLRSIRLTRARKAHHATQACTSQIILGELGALCALAVSWRLGPDHCQNHEPSRLLLRDEPTGIGSKPGSSPGW